MRRSCSGTKRLWAITSARRWLAADRYRALLIAGRGVGQAPQRPPLVRTAEGADSAQPTGDREIRHAGAGEHEPRQARDRRSKARVRERRCSEHPLRKENVRLQAHASASGAKRRATKAKLSFTARILTARHDGA